MPRSCLAVLFSVFALLASTLAPAQTPWRWTGSTQDGYFLNLNTVSKITCIKLPDGMTLEQFGALAEAGRPPVVRNWSGTGTVIARNRVLTAAHVLDGATACLFQNKLLRTVYLDNRLDAAVAVADLGDTPVTPVNCDGLVAGTEYLGVGYAHGRDFAMQRFSFGGSYANQTLKGGGRAVHQGVMGGEAHPGMSGGPVVNGAGEVVAVINTGGPDRAGVRDLTETPLCAALQWRTPAPR